MRSKKIPNGCDVIDAEGKIENLTVLDIDTDNDVLISHPERVKRLKQL